MVREEVMSTRQKFDLHRNELEDQFPSNEDRFKFLELMTDRKTDRICLKEKPLSFKSKSKGHVDIIIRNTDKFKRFCEQKNFQRQDDTSI